MCASVVEGLLHKVFCIAVYCYMCTPNRARRRTLESFHREYCKAPGTQHNRGIRPAAK